MVMVIQFLTIQLMKLFDFTLVGYPRNTLRGYKPARPGVLKIKAAGNTIFFVGGAVL
jgi:hypothetical protein